ncbi:MULTISPECIES: NAD(P)H-dependent oxidoreductase [Halanaerobium]|jgi:multimeric flavodoxin WrbA|uniref:Flavodoxin-like fold n=1 Tax=Halanaerobium kushneri TaxID=56779 RepID=A0A1N6PG10_9FIRM|nr:MULTISPECIES: NAD(P)H-dependent oxidoreductase [Halanaerobium]RCW51351.1 flavodoxin-like protein [Halanaerobium sp. ST460_2HS_T2]SIQ03260.1 Flavodoxin-like fold [Halanaerobium kushneri]
MTIKKAILLIGSPKGMESSSASLGTYLLSKIEEYDIMTEKVHLHSEIATEAKRIMFLDKIEEADFIILAAPLYVDTLPAKVIKALRLIAEKRKTLYFDDIKSAKNQSFIAVVNCGFPEAEQNKTALKIYQEFAREAKLKYLGGIAVGMGGAVSGKSLSEMGGMAKDLVAGLDQAADDIVRNHQLSDFVVEKTSKPMISQKWLYTLVGNFTWRFQALRNGVYSRMKDRPYQKEEA